MGIYNETFIEQENNTIQLLHSAGQDIIDTESIKIIRHALNRDCYLVKHDGKPLLSYSTLHKIAHNACKKKYKEHSLQIGLLAFNCDILGSGMFPLAVAMEYNFYSLSCYLLSTLRVTYLLYYRPFDEKKYDDTFYLTYALQKDSPLWLDLLLKAGLYLKGSQIKYPLKAGAHMEGTKIKYPDERNKIIEMLAVGEVKYFLDDNLDLMHCAAKNNAEKCIRYLYAQGYDINQKDKHGRTALSLTIARCLGNSFYDKNSLDTIQDNAKIYKTIATLRELETIDVQKQLQRHKKSAGGKSIVGDDKNAYLYNKY